MSSEVVKNSVLCMGPGTHGVPLKLFETNRRRLVERLKSKNIGEGSIVLLQGGNDVPVHDTDTTYLFRQESYFMWAFGITDPGCYGAIEVDSGNAHIFIPKFPADYGIWMGRILERQEWGQKYAIENVHYVEDIKKVMSELKPNMILTLKGMNTDSGLCSKEANFKGIETFNVNNTLLFNEIADLRVFKTDLEIEVLKYVIEVSSAAHRKVMRCVEAGKSEYQCESEFLHYCYQIGGCRHVSYTCICGTGPNASILHYGHAGAPNDRKIKEGDMCLFDMGANYFGYASDITCSYPVNGKFSEDQKMIYNAVLRANLAVLSSAKPGVSWADLHVLAITTLLEDLKKGGILVGDVQEMLKAGVGAIFQPHGLGHLMGLDVHDVGGYLPNNPPRPKHVPGVDKLRTARILEERMVLTIEPGCYFIDHLLDQALKDSNLSKYFVAEAVSKFRNFGGVRIEDDVLITKDGAINLTKVPRTVEEIERWMAGHDDEKY
ncbi:xaa-Pro dipeptidase [Coccinella septempunctata]|uniref:xaa-Pro dipeptidase n=1 Tax=Coccinella septempunctata TaxID=41139 RepID=UPI001D0995AC|nr:xaa-Pro dipeptidase [Coccinella septempunctata]